MAANGTRIGDVRPFVLWASLLGLGMVAIAASPSVASGDGVRAAAVAVLLGWPFVLGLLALPGRGRRWLLLLAALGAVAVAIPTVFSGLGWWLGATALVYLWAWWALRHDG